MTMTTAEATEGAAEIVAYDSSLQQFFVVNAEDASVDVLSMGADGTVSKVTGIDVSSYGAGANSVAANGGKIAVAIEVVNGSDSSMQEDGKVLVFDGNDFAAAPTEFTVGALPDMVTFTPDGSKLLVANEGEANDQYTFDPNGSISVIDLGAASVTTMDFADFAGSRAAELPAGFRITGKNATVASDSEPEYVAVSADGTKAWVSMQENNALARVNLETPAIEAILDLGTKDYSLEANAIDPSDKDEVIDLAPRANVVGMYMPDGITTMEANGKTYVLTANEGDSREYFFDAADEAACTAAGGLEFDAEDGCLAHIDEIRAKDLGSDYGTSPVSSDLTARTDGSSSELGRLKVSTINGIENGEVTTLYSFGARSFSIFDGETGERVYDSGSEFITNFVASGLDTGYVQGRGDDKGVEPEAVIVGELGGKQLAFIALERASGVMVYDVTDPANSSFVEYIKPMAADAAAGQLEDVSPEGLVFVPAAESATGKAMLVVANEVSGTTSFYELSY